MHLWEIILALGAIGSLAMWLRELLAKQRPWREYIYPVIAIVLAVSSAVLYSQNSELLDPAEQARVLVKSWPDKTYDGSFHEAQAKGIVLAGLRYLETYKHLYPDTYERHKQEFETTNFGESIQATYAADTMITSIKSYAGEPIQLH